jgi:hypothetical protein
MLVASIGASPCLAQTRVTSIDELRRALSRGDSVTIVPQDGTAVEGRLTRIGAIDLDVRAIEPRTGPTKRVLTIPFETIQSLQRRRDSPVNGALIGAGIGAGAGGALFVNALIVDRNEIDEWAPMYVGMTAAFAGIGALIGWTLDKARSKPPIRYSLSDGHKAARYDCERDH